MENFSCLWVIGTETTCSNEPLRPSEVPDGLCHSLSVDLSNNVGTEEIDKQTIRKRIWNLRNQGHNKVPLQNTVSHLVQSTHSITIGVGISNNDSIIFSAVPTILLQRWIFVGIFSFIYIFYFLLYMFFLFCFMCVFFFILLYISFLFCFIYLFYFVLYILLFSGC